MLITQPTNPSDDDQNTGESIPKISKSDMSREKDFEIPEQRYQGPKIVPMPDNCSKKSVLPLNVLCSVILSERRANELDIAFLRDITNNEACPEYNGCNTMVTRQQGVSMQPKTKAVYLPLIDMTPSDPDTIMTARHEAKRLKNEARRMPFSQATNNYIKLPSKCSGHIQGSSQTLSTVLEGCTH